MVKDVMSLNAMAVAEQQSIAQAIESICAANESACRRILGESLRELDFPDRRGDGRNRISLPFYLSPLNSPPLYGSSPARALQWSDPPPLIAVTRDLSTRGVGFRCDTPISLGQAIADFDGHRAGRIRLLLEIRWRRRQSLHCYLAGGLILSVLEPDELDVA